MDEKLLDLEGQFGLIGYALYFKFLEVLTRSDDYEIEWNDRKCGVMARHFLVTKDELNDFIVAATMGNNSALLLQDGYLFSPGLKKRLDPLQEKRDKEALRQKINREILAATSSRQLDLLQQQYQLSEQQKVLLHTLREEKRREEKNRIYVKEGDHEILPENPQQKIFSEKDINGEIIFYSLESMQASTYWNEVREYVALKTGKLPSQHKSYLNSAKEDYNLDLTEKGKWSQGISPKSFAAGLSKRINNGWTPEDRKKQQNNYGNSKQGETVEEAFRTAKRG